MAIENLVRLSRSILAEPIGFEGVVIISASGKDGRLNALPKKLREDVESLLHELGSTIPNDFAVHLAFVSGGVRLSVDLEDGNTSSDAMNAFFTSGKSLRQKCLRCNWNAKRDELIKEGSVFEELVKGASDRPVNIPSSIEASRKYPDAMGEIYARVKSLKERQPPFAMAIARDDCGVQIDDYRTRGEVVYMIAEFMTVDFDILAVFEGRRPWAVEEIEDAKLEAVKQLGPISRAKAERRLRL